MDDREVYEYYADPANREPAGPPRKRKGQRLASMTSVRFAPGVIGAVKDIASGEGVTVGWWIRRLVERELTARRPGTGAERPAGIPSSPAGRTFGCPHLTISNVTFAECAECGPMTAAAWEAP